ncbi:MAG: DNA primase [Pseudomonadota bacterium]
MSISPGYLETLRDRVSIAETIGRRISFDNRKSVPAKGDYWACCPFHGEKTPSFHVHEKKGFFYCFGCHENGSAIDFVMKFDRLGFREAVEVLAQEAGMPPPARDPQAARREAVRLTLTEATEAAVAFFRDQLQSGAGRAARAYLAQRGLTEEMIERFEIGFAPDARDAALRALSAAGFAPAMLRDADICDASSRDGTLYDRFRNRIMFPIRDVKGRCIAFGGRALSKDAKAKYLNSRETDLFKKGSTLYNLGRARGAVSRERPLLVVEGYMDVISLAQVGYEAAVAPLGTALTDAQLGLMWRAADEPILALDGDAAGQRAAAKAADLALPLLKPGKSLGFAALPPGLDPDDLARSKGAVGIEALAAQAEPLIDHLWRREVDGARIDTPERRAALEARLAALIGRIDDPTVRRHYDYALKERRFHLFRSIQKARGARRRGGGGDAHAPAPRPTAEARAKALAEAAASDDPGVLREGAILLLLLGSPTLLIARCDEVEALDFIDPILDSVKNALLSGVAMVDEPDAAVDGDEIASRLTRLFEGAVDERCGEGLCEELRTRFRERLGSPFERACQSAEDASLVFDELVAMHSAQLTWRREIEAYEAELLEDDVEDAAPHRLIEAQRDLVRSQGGGAVEETAGGAEAALSDRLNRFVNDEPWIKRKKQR